MEAINLTELELIALKSITQSDFYERGRDSIPWDFSVFDCCPLSGKTRSGVFSSLSQKGLVNITEKEKPHRIDENGNKVKNLYYSRDCNFGTIQISLLGYEVLDSKKLIDEDGCFI
jgi:hypothetical protein